MIIDPKKKAGTLATPRTGPKEFKEPDLSSEAHLGMRNVMERLRQPKITSMASRAQYNKFPWK